MIRFLEELVFARKICPEEVAGILVEPIQGEGGAGSNTVRSVPALNVSPAHLDEAPEFFESVPTTAGAG